MKAVGIREIKARLSEYVRRARAGETVLITDRGEVVAEMVTPRMRASSTGEDAAMDDLVRIGVLSRGAPNDPEAYPDLAPLVPEGESSVLLDEERGR